MSIKGALSNAYSGLSANSRLAEIVSRNVANASTEGYAARSLALGNRVIVDAGAGVTVNGPVRAGDALLTADRRRADARAEFQGDAAATLRAVSDLLNPRDAADGLAARYADFENALKQLADTPESPTIQANVADAASVVTRSLNAITTDARRVRVEADADIARQVAAVNSALSKIEKLNKEIATATATGRDATALVDERERQIEVVNSIVPIRSAPQSDGRVALFSQGGAVLLEGTAQQLGFTATPVITEDMTLASGALSNVTLYGADAAPTAPTNAAALRGGTLEAAFRARDETIPAFTAQMDAVARDLIERFQSAGVDPTLLPGDAGLFVDSGPGGPALDLIATPGQQSGLAGRIGLNAAVDPAQGGALFRLRDGINAAAPGPAGASAIPRALVDAFTALRLPSPPLTADISGFDAPRDAAGLVAGLASLREGDAAQAENTAAASRGAAATLTDEELSVTGVDTDAELRDLLAIEKAYAANARVLQVVDSLMQRILEI